MEFSSFPLPCSAPMQLEISATPLLSQFWRLLGDLQRHHPLQVKWNAIAGCSPTYATSGQAYWTKQQQEIKMCQVVSFPLEEKAFFS